MTHEADVALAAACLAGDADALVRLDRELVECVDRAVRKLGGDRAIVDEVAQRLRTRLLVGDGARITEYSGRGPLRAWLRVVATRELLDMKRHDKLETPMGDATLDALPGAEHDPELQYLKASYRAAFRDAFRAAFAALEPRERDLLRRHHLRGQNIDALAARLTVHRATAARWVARARERLLEETRARLAASLEVDDRELDSILGLIASRLEVSLRSQI